MDMESELRPDRWTELRATDDGFISFVMKQCPEYTRERIESEIESFRVIFEEEYLDLLEVGEMALKADFKFLYQ